MAESKRPNDLIDANSGTYYSAAPSARPSDLINVDPEYVSSQVNPLNQGTAIAGGVAMGKPVIEKVLNTITGKGDVAGRKSMERYLKSQLNHEYPGLTLEALKKELAKAKQPNARVSTQHEVQQALKAIAGQNPSGAPIDISQYTKTPRPTTMGGKIAQPFGAIGNVVESMSPQSTSMFSKAIRGTGRGALGAGSAYKATDAYNKALEGDVAGAAGDASTAAGLGLMLSSNPKTKGIGAVAAGVPFLGNLIGNANAEPMSPNDAAGTAFDVATGFAGPLGMLVSPSTLGDATLDRRKKGAYRQGDTGVLSGTQLPEMAVGGSVDFGSLSDYLEMLKKKAEQLGQPQQQPMPQMAEGGRPKLPGKLGKFQKLVENASNLSKRAVGSFDPRFDKRVGEIPKLQNTVLHSEQKGVKDVPPIYLPDYEGHPFITSISDRSYGGAQLQGINDVMFNNPVDLTGGKLYMYNNPGKVWAAGDVPADNIMRQARALKDFTGKDPLYVPWQMAPTGSDFSHMTGQTMLAYAESAMPKSEKKQLDKYLKNIIPGWKGIDNPESMKQFLSAPAGVRGAVQDLMDKNFRDSGGIGIGQARLAIADPEQLVGRDGSVSHVGRIFADQDPIRNTGNASYPSGIPGEGLGKIPEDFNIYQLLSKQAEKRGVVDPANPTRPDLRSIEVFPSSGVLDEKTLMNMGFKNGGLVALENK